MVYGWSWAKPIAVPLGSSKSDALRPQVSAGVRQDGIAAVGASMQSLPMAAIKLMAFTVAKSDSELSLYAARWI